MADVSNGICPAVVHYVVRGGEHSWQVRSSISLEKGECDIWLRAFHTVSCPLLSLCSCFIIKGDSDHFPLDPLPELLPSFFLPSELSSSSVTSTDVIELFDDRARAGLLLVLYLLECSDLLESFFSSRTCCFSASTVSMFLSCPVRSLDDILLFGSTILVSRSVLDRL